MVWAQSLLCLGSGAADGPLHSGSGLLVGTQPYTSTQVLASWNFLSRGPSLGSWLGPRTGQDSSPSLDEVGIIIIRSHRVTSG